MPQNSPFTESYKEALVSSPSDTVIIDTLELYHEAFESTVRITNQYVEKRVRLELDAPYLTDNEKEEVIDGGTDRWVTFLPTAFKMSLPKSSGIGGQSLNISIANTDKLIVQHLEMAIADPSPIVVIYRPFLSTDLSQPAMDPPIVMLMSQASADANQVNGKATFGGFINKSFPSKFYTSEFVPGLLRT